MFFCNSGAEANEAALKLARKFGGRGRHAVVSAYGSFHGRTLATLAATGQPAKHEPFFPMPDGFRHVAFNDLDALEAAVDPSVAAVLLEPVQGEGGVIPADPQYLRDVRALCDERGLLLIMDEVQTGMGRLGKWFGFEHAGIVPDVVTMAKGIGNGFPVGAVWAKTRRRRRVPARRPRQHLQRHGAGHGRRQRGDRRDAADRRAAPGRRAGRLPRATSCAALPGVAERARRRACCWPPSWTTGATPRRCTPT